ncbi:MAG: amidinotransferase [Flavobacteriales bacterium]|nr:amidinotransferase [Flavobacteriales bacterium]
MIRPVKFNYNAETALDNKYQSKITSLSPKVISHQATHEFDNFVTLLKSNNINVLQFSDIEENNTPDSIFPNNWISTHFNGIIHLYPMYASSRRLERRNDIIISLQNQFTVNHLIDDTCNCEHQNIFLEGTGSMVLDRENKIAYACISKRTNLGLFNSWCKEMNYSPVAFYAKDKGQDIYHTNVVMSVCEDFVVICLDAIINPADKAKVKSVIKKTNKKIINISIEQMNNFLGNVIQLINNRNQRFLVMSTSAFNSLKTDQKKIILEKNKILHSSLQTIEYFGGGSARCMIAEIFLKPLI